eukprot:5416366-Pyramimonas_sp.AAC.1
MFEPSRPSGPLEVDAPQKIIPAYCGVVRNGCKCQNHGVVSAFRPSNRAYVDDLCCRLELEKLRGLGFNHPFD